MSIQIILHLFLPFVFFSYSLRSDTLFHMHVASFFFVYFLFHLPFVRFFLIQLPFSLSIPVFPISCSYPQFLMATTTSIAFCIVLQYTIPMKMNSQQRKLAHIHSYISFHTYACFCSSHTYTQIQQYIPTPRQIKQKVKTVKDKFHPVKFTGTNQTYALETKNSKTKRKEITHINLSNEYNVLLLPSFYSSIERCLCFFFVNLISSLKFSNVFRDAIVKKVTKDNYCCFVTLCFLE